MPVWEELGRHCDLDVVILESPEHLERDGFRGADWIPPTIGHSFGLAYAKTIGRSRTYGPLYVLLSLNGLRLFMRDVVILGGWDQPAYWQVRLISWLLGTPTLAFYESTLESMHHRTGPLVKARSAFFKSMAGVLTPGEAATRAVVASGVPATRIFEGFNAVDMNPFIRVVAETQAIPSHAGHVFIFVGQLVERKNPLLVLQAFSAIRNAEDRLLVVGEGHLRDQLKRRVHELHLEDAVVMTGHLDMDALAAHLAHADTLVLPSSEEVWGLVVNEGLAAGCHAIVSRPCGCVPSVRGMRGVYETDVDADDLARVMNLSRSQWSGRIGVPEILACTPEAFATVIRAGITRVVEAPARS